MNYNISYDVCGIVILALLWLILQKIYVMTSKSNKLFRRFVVIGLFAVILDLVTAYTIDYSAYIHPALNLILNTIYCFMQNYATYSGARYTFSAVRLRTKIHSRINKCIIAVYSVLLFVNLFTGILFDFHGRTYNKGPLYYVTFAVSIVLIIHFGLMLIVRHKIFTKKQLFLFSSFVYSPVVFVSIQLIHPEYLMTGFSTAIGAMLVLFAVETPDFVELEYLRKNLENEVQTRTRDLKKANEELERKNKQAKQDMELAAHLQQELLKHNFNFLGWDIAVKFEPLSGISGDLYDFYVLEGKLRGFGLFDVSGHGISSGLVTVLAKNAIFHEFRTTIPLKLSDAMKRINNSVIRVKGGIENYLTGVICRIDRDDPSKIELANAGAPYPVLKAKNKKKSVLIMPDKSKPQYGMIGVEGLDVCFQTIKKKLAIDDVLVFYTDGLIESENDDGDQYGMMRIQDVVDRVDGTAQVILDAIYADFKDFIGENKVEDDISIMVIKRTEEVASADVVEELELADN